MTSSDAVSVLRKPLHAAVTARLRAMIMDGRLKPGERINENALAHSMDVSRTPLREALKTLQGEGLILTELHRGTYVSEITVEETAELFEALAGIERICGELAVRRLGAVELRKLQALHDEMYAFHAEKDRERYFELNDRIHRAIVKLSGNTRLITFHAKLIVGATRARFAALHHAARWDESVDEHKGIMTAIEDRDAGEAGRLIHQHVHQTGALVCTMLDKRTPDAP